MYNKKAKTSAILAIVTAVLVLGLVILLPVSLFNTEADNLFAALFFAIFGVLGFLVLLVGAIPFVIVALVLGTKMLKQPSRKALISLNVRLLIATCVLLPLLAAGTLGNVGSILSSTLAPFPILYTVLTAISYLSCLVTQIVTIVVLKKTPKEEETSKNDVAALPQ